MKKILFIPILLFSLLAFTQPAHSQNLADRLSENEVITAVDLYNARKFPQAVEILQKTVKEHPANDAAHFYLGLSYFCLQDNESAERELKAAAELDPSNFWYRYRLAMLYSVTGKEELTLAMFEELIRDFPKKYDLYYNMIDLYRTQGQQEKALETLEQIETVFGRNELTALARFDIMRNMGQEEEAFRYLEEFNQDNSSVQVLSILGDRQLSMYNDSLAIALYDEALDIDPGYVPALLGKVEAYRITRKYDRFFGVLQQFVSDKDIPSSGKCSYLNVLVRSMDQMFFRNFRSQMDSVMTVCSELHPADTSVNFTSGIYYYATGRKELAKKSFKSNVDLNPESLGAAATYVEMLMYMSEWEDMAATCEESSRRFPKEAAFLEYESMAQYNLGNYDQVISLCGKVLEVAPEDSAKTLDAYSTMGDMYFRTGEKKKAYKCYDKALDINPDHIPVLNNYAYYLSLEGRKLKKAYEMSKRTVELEPDNSTYLDTFGWILYLMGKPLEAKPFFKNAVMLYGGKESPVILDHYAEVLYALKEYDLAMVYWSQAKSRNNGQIEGLDEKVNARKNAIKSDRK